MNKYRFTNKEILHTVIISVLYVTWIVSMHVLVTISGHSDKYITYTNLTGSVIALIYTIFLHYPLIPIFSKYINQRTEKEAVELRRSYCIKVLYTIILGFFGASFLTFLQMDKYDVHLMAQSWGVLGIEAATMMTLYCVFTIRYAQKMKTLLYVDKLQHKNADIEG